MEFCEGGQVNDRAYMVAHGIDTLDVSKKIGSLYSEMIFVNGYVHCDPHPGNVLVQAGEGKDTQIVLLDHGLYTVSFGRKLLCYVYFCRSSAERGFSSLSFYP